MRADPRFKPLPLEAATLLTEGKVIEAIQAVRQAELLRLTDAKGRVAAHIARDPMLRVQIETQQRAARRKFFFWFLIVDVVVAAGVIYWLYYRGQA
ncbi:MAG: hypothetical protein ABI769_05935 [Pseudomonadota bacterium]